jgi:hypothetical protein
MNQRSGRLHDGERQLDGAESGSAALGHGGVRPEQDRTASARGLDEGLLAGGRGGGRRGRRDAGMCAGEVQEHRSLTET